MFEKKNTSLFNVQKLKQIRNLNINLLSKSPTFFVRTIIFLNCLKIPERKRENILIFCDDLFLICQNEKQMDEHI